MGDKGEGGIKKSQKMGDIIYGRPLEIKKTREFRLNTNMLNNS